MRTIDADTLREAFDVAIFNDEDDYKKALRIIDNAPTIRTFTLADIEEQYLKGLEKGLSEWETERPQGEWIVTAEDNDGVHRICCPFCSYEKGSNNTDPIVVTFTNFPKFCENCGADMRGEEE